MKKGCLVLLVVGLISAVVLAIVLSVVLPVWWRSACRVAGDQFRKDAVGQIGKWSEDGWTYSNVVFLAQQRERTYGHEWLSDHLISMDSGEWIVYFAECSKANPRIADIFVGKSSDGKWYYSTYHFCVGMMNIRTRPPTLVDFTNDYSLCEFDGDASKTYGNTETIQPPLKLGSSKYQ